MDWTALLSIILPVITGIVGWFTGRRKQKNDFLNDLQSSINMLAGKNEELIEKVVKLREENAELRVEVSNLRIDNESLRKEIGDRLDGVKITNKSKKT